MPRDYKQPARRKRRSSRRSARRWPWLFSGLAAGFLAGFVVYAVSTGGAAKKAAPAEQKTAAAPAPKAAPPKAEQRKENKDSKDDAGEKSRFDFYTLLPEMEVKISNDASTAARGTAKKGTEGPYLLQVGSFRSHAEADGLKARLALIGVEASIQPVIISADNTWYRVRVGPYKNLQDLQQARTSLQRNNIPFMLLQLGA